LIESTGRTVQFLSDTHDNYVHKDIKLYYVSFSEINLDEFSHVLFTSEFVNSDIYKTVKKTPVKTVFVIPESLHTKYNERMIYTNRLNNSIPLPQNLDTLVDEVWIRDTQDDTKLFLKTTLLNKLQTIPMMFEPIFKNIRIQSKSYNSVKTNIIIMDKNEHFMTLGWKSLIIANSIYVKNKDRISNVYLFNKPDNKEGISEYMMHVL
jgi:hypothetical protein